MRLLWPCVVALLTGLAATGAYGQQDLDAGKTGPQLFAQDCAACHKSPQGLVKTISGGALVGFLRQHYTSSSASANMIAGYLLAAGGPPRNDRQKDQAKQPGQNQDRAKLARPGDAAATRPPAAAPPVPPANVPMPPASQLPTSPSPTSQVPTKQHRLAHPGNATTDQGGAEQPGRS